MHSAYTQQGDNLYHAHLLEAVTDCIIIMQRLLEFTCKNYVIILAMLSSYRLKSILSRLKYYYKVVEENKLLYRYLITFFAILQVCISLSVRKCIISAFEWMYALVHHILYICVSVCTCIFVCICVYVCAHYKQSL